MFIICWFVNIWIEVLLNILTIYYYEVCCNDKEYFLYLINCFASICHNISAPKHYDKNEQAFWLVFQELSL